MLLSDLSIYFLIFNQYDYRFLIYSKNNYSIKNFQISYDGRIYFFRNDVNSFSPTQLSSKFSYSYFFRNFSIFIDHFCENTIEYKPYDIKRFDILGIKYKNFGVGWTFNKRYVNYEFWFLYEFHYFLFRGSFYFGISEDFRKIYPFISIWMLNVLGIESFSNPNSADTLKQGEIPNVEKLSIISIGASLGFLLNKAKLEFNKYIPIDNYIYNFNYKYEVDFLIKNMFGIRTYLEANSATQLIYPKWLVLGMNLNYRGFGIGLSELYTTNVRYEEKPIRRKEYFLSFLKNFKNLELDLRYRLYKSDSLRRAFLKFGINFELKSIFLNLKYEIFSNSFDGYIGFKYSYFRIYYLHKLRSRLAFDYFSDTNNLFGIQIEF
ncbi:MAG: hypothetical protein N2504_00685 [candidate division WOR-3 bacterium]|nr:hypothetical protein [candidate division WOR-3 bacterium]